MKCRTSSSDLAILKKDLTRFAPVWLGLCAYLLIWGMTLLTSDYVYNSMAYEPIAPIFAPILSIVLFSYLFDPNECFMVHSLPIRRERLFGIHVLSGLLMFLVPTAVFCFVTRNVAEQTAMYRFLFTAAEFLLLFSIGVLCAMLAGRIIGAAGIFLFIMALPGMLDYIVQDLYLPSLPGVYLMMDFYAWNPLLIVSAYANFYDRTTFVALDWLFLGAVVLISMALLGVSLLLYRKRKLEHAGDLLSVSTLEPVFAVCAFFSGAAIMTAMFYGPDATVLGAVVGYYGYWMLSRKTARVFTKKVNLGLVGLLAFFIVSGLVVESDPLDRVHYVPETEQIETASLRTAPGSLDRLETTDPALIDRIMELHRDLLEISVDGGQNSGGPQFHIVYELTNGQTIQRNYTCGNESLIDQWDWLLSQPEAIFGSENPEFARVAVEEDHFTYRIILTEERMNELCEIMLKECRSGDMHHYRNDHYYWQLTIYLADKPEPVHLWVPETAVETIAWLETNCAP